MTCGCKVERYGPRRTRETGKIEGIVFCPLHSSAEEMLQAVKDLLPLFKDLEDKHIELLPFGKATFNYERRLIARAESKEGK